MNLIEFKQKNAGVSVKPILFSTEMVKAILEGRKTQTRRTLKKQPEHNNLRYDGYDYEDEQKHWFEELKDGEPTEQYIEAGKCPYGKPGDILWVRESTCFVGGGKYLYKANSLADNMKWKPNIHMPFEAARIFLKIKSVSVERLQSISHTDALAEGIKRHIPAPGDGPTIYEDYTNKYNYFYREDFSFLSLWESIYGLESRNANPWVWVVKFERIDINK